MASYKGDRLADGTPLNQAVYKAYRNAGLSHNQALAITAEVGRENSFQAKYIFGGHIDPAGAKGGGTIQNIGMISWNGSRAFRLRNYLAQKGLMGKSGMVRTQATLDAQAQFSVQEMKTNYRNGLQNFWANPNASPESFARELGKNYIVWAYGQNSIRDRNGGRIPFNWRSHDDRRRGHLNTLVSMVGSGQSQPNQPQQQPLQQMTSRFLSPRQIAQVLPQLAQQNIQPKNTLFFGDSIAHGYRTANKASGTTKVGANPSQVLAQLQSTLATNPNAFKGQNVVLSSGLSNGDDVASIEKQLQLLKNAGANVSLLGVSNSFNVGGRTGDKMNAHLANIAKNYGANFRGGFVAGADNVHPKTYAGFAMPTQNTSPQQVMSAYQGRQPQQQSQVNTFTPHFVDLNAVRNKAKQSSFSPEFIDLNVIRDKVKSSSFVPQFIDLNAIREKIK